MLQESKNRLLAVLADPNCKQLSRNIIGFLGELLVLEKLLGEGVEAEHKGGQATFDIIMKGGKSNFSVDVKTSRSKDEFENVFNYGWQLKDGKSRTFVLLSLTSNFQPLDYYVVPSTTDINNFRVGLGRYNNVEYAFNVLANEKDLQKLSDSGDYKSHIMNCQQHLANGLIFKLRNDQRLSDLIIEANKSCPGVEFSMLS